MKTYIKPAIVSTVASLSAIKDSANKNSSVASDNNGLTFSATAPAYEADE